VDQTAAAPAILKRPSRRRRAPGPLRWLIMLLIVAAVISGVLWGTVWWEERPLAEAEKYLREKNYEGALANAETFLKHSPGHGRAIALKARALVYTGNAAEAARLFDQVGAASPEEIRDCAKAYLMQERWVEALPVLEYLVQQSPDDPDLLHELSACRARLGRFDGAIEMAKAFAAIEGFEARGYLLVGTIEHERGNDKKACEAWEHVLKIAPDLRDLQVPAYEFQGQYGNALLKTGNASEAVVVLRKSIEMFDSPEIRANLGQALLQLGQDAEAEEQWTKTLEISPKNQIARQGLAELAMRKSKFDAALEFLEPIAGEPDLAVSSAFLLQRAYSMAGQADKASEWKERLELIRKRDELQHTVDQVLIESAETMWGQALRAYRFAEQGNIRQAEALLSPLLGKPDVHPFISSLGEAIRNRTQLPDLDGIPLELF
jgi:tetratricopeptide (TPR) repeat protein